MTADISVRALRSEMRFWRRQRANTTLFEQLSEAYIWVFTTVMVGAMAISAMVQTRVSIAASCTASTCDDARTSLVWVSVIAAVAIVLAVAQTTGPVMVTPATGTWLLTTPVDRTPLLRSRLLLACSASLFACGMAVGVFALLAGFSYGSVTTLALTAALAGTGATAAAALWQPGDRRRARLAAILFGSLAWLWLLVIAFAATPTTSHVWSRKVAGWAVLAGVAAAAMVILAFAIRALPALRRAQLVPGGSLLSSLSGALASLDLALAYDVLVARRWLTAATVRPVRGGPGGIWALVWRDVVRLRRTPGAVIALAATLVVPYVTVTLGLDDVVVPVSALAAFVAGLWLCSSLRTTGRNPGLVRCFPMRPGDVRTAALAVPTIVLVVWGFAAAPAISRTLDGSATGDAVLIGVATGMAALGAIARWLLAAPPDYSRPLVSSPAGAIPTGLIGSLFRGFDVLALLTVPLIVSPTAAAALISLFLTSIVLSVLVNRR